MKSDVYLPSNTSSRRQYVAVFDKKYVEYCKKNNTTLEDGFINYFVRSNNAPSTLWKEFSMIKAGLQIRNIKIKKQDINLVVRLLKNRMKSFRQKQAKHFTGNDIKKYLTSERYDGEQHYVWKVLIMIGIVCCLRIGEIRMIMFEDILVQKETIGINIQRSKSDQNGSGCSFVIGKVQNTKLCVLMLYQKYIETLKSQGIALTGRLFRTYRQSIGRYIKTPIGEGLIRSYLRSFG